MRTGYAIRDGQRDAWLQTRVRVEGTEHPVTVYVQDEEDAMQFHRLKDAKAMLKVVRKDHRRPERVRILDPRWRVIV